MAYQNNNFRSEPERKDSKDSSGKDRLIQVVIALAAVAALVISIIGLISSKESANAAKQSADSAAQANRLASEANQLASEANQLASRANELSSQVAGNTLQQQTSAQARDVSFLISTTDNQNFVQIINLSASSIRDVFFAYSQTSTPQYYEYVNLVKPCSEWQAIEDQRYNLWLYFEDSTGNYWELDPSGNLHQLTGQPQVLSNLTNASGGWQPQEQAMSCAP